MPCFKGLAVSIHTNDGPLPEYSIQKQGRFSRITSYIPVPPPKVPTHPGAKPEQSTFAISITLLTPGINVPYSTPKPTDDDPYPRPQIVGGLPGLSGERGRHSSVIGPYQPISSSPNETIAAYIYFDGRPKEEVATLLRRGEETWVNSRWVGIPESEGGGLAEREFLFREVGLERWLNGLDLSGKDAAAQLEKRKQKIERKRQRRRIKTEHSDMSDEDGPSQWRAARDKKASKGVLRYGTDAQAPLEKISDEDEMFSTDSDSDDDPIPEATGQIKVALFRVLASGEIKKGEYSPQYSAHDDDDDFMKGTNGSKAGNGEADIDHTTSFAKPKTLDPKSISTQTVTGIDGPEKPYAVFTFLYRGQKQLQKMGILKSKTTDKAANPTKRRSIQTDFANLKPLSKKGTVGFTSFRDLADKAGTPRKSRALSGAKGSPPSSSKRARDHPFDSDGSDASDEDEGAMTPTKKGVLEVETDDFKTILSSEDAKRQGELAEGVKKIRLKRQHSFESPLPASPAPAKRNSPPTNTSNDSPLPPLHSLFAPTSSTMQNSPPQSPTTTATLSAAGNLFLPSSTYEPPPSASTTATNGVIKKQTTPPLEVGSPLKKRRSSQHNNGSAMDRVLSMEPRALDAQIWGKGGDGKEGGLEGIGEEKKGVFGTEEGKTNGMFGGLLGKMAKEDVERLNGKGEGSSLGTGGEKAGDVGMDEDEL